MESEKRLAEIEGLMSLPDFWNDKEKAKEIVREYNTLKTDNGGGENFDKGDAIVSILSGAGGDDAEDFSAMLFKMYRKYIDSRDWSFTLIHKNENDHNGFRNITFEISGKNAYGDLENESGVHRLVRVSPFNAQKKRHTSFSLVEVIPKLKKIKDAEITENELSVTFTRSSGPGGQNVNKRETAVRIVHLPTKLSVHVDSERSQHDNREKAMEILRGKIYKMREEDRLAKEKGMQIAQTTSIEWGSQIRSYVLHPYKMVKDHRTGIETAKVDDVLEEGKIDDFIDAEREL